MNVLATFIAIAFIDKMGRRPLLLAGFIGMGVSLGVVGIAMHADMPGMVTLGALVAFIVSFAFSLGPVVWTVINEIFPGAIRGRAVAIATAVNWASAFIVSEFFLSLLCSSAEAETFWLFAFFCADSVCLGLRPGAGDQESLAGRHRTALAQALIRIGHRKDAIPNGPLAKHAASPLRQCSRLGEGHRASRQECKPLSHYSHA